MTNLTQQTTSAPVSPRFEAIRAKVQSTKQKLLVEIVEGVEQLAEEGDWRGVIRLASEVGGLSQADIARGLEVTRSTVMRWVNGDTRPVAGVMPSMAKRLVLMLRAD